MLPLGTTVNFRRFQFYSVQLRLQRPTIQNIFLLYQENFTLSGRWQNTIIFVISLTVNYWHNMHFQTEDLSSVPQIDTAKANK